MHNLAPISPDVLDINIESGLDFLDTFGRDIDSAGEGDQIAFVTMSMEPAEEKVAEILAKLNAAAERGAEVHFGTDAFTFLVDNTSASVGPLLLPTGIRQGAFRRRQQALDELAEHDTATVNVLNRPSRLLKNPFAGRSHLKAAAIKTKSFSKSYIIGPNLHAVHRTDMALGFESVPVTDKLYQTLVDVIETGSTHEVFGGVDQEWQIDPVTKLLIDSGKPNQSGILDAGLDIIDTSDVELTGTFQYVPRGAVAASLAAAALREVDAVAFYNDPAVQGIVGRYPEALVERRARARAPEALSLLRLPAGTHMHSKGLASETTALAGNHNFDPRGVKFGTAEFAILRNDPAFAQRLADFLFAQVGVPRIRSARERTEQRARSSAA